MKNKFQLFILFLILYSFIIIYYPWFINTDIIGGDWPYYFDEAIKGFPPLVPSWSTWQINGLGGTDTIYFLNSFQFFTFFIKNFFHLPWNLVYKIFWFGFFLFFSFFSVSYLIKKLFPKIDFLYVVLAGFFYTTNTYILMVVGGGQMGVALAYSVAPLVLTFFMQCVNTITVSNPKLSILAGLTLALQVLFDPRLAYITMIFIVLYVLFNLLPFLITAEKLKNNLYLIYKYGFYIFIIPLGVTVLLHMFWILPLIFLRQNSIESLGGAYTASSMVRFLSFANFSDSLSLLQPNWPDNIFGKIYFMRPQFLFLPILAYVSLLFLSFKHKQSLLISKTILFFSFIGLVGAFLGKGANPPFGDVYIFLFDHVPGFVVFRDPTKWYLLTAVAFSILIPYSVYSISSKIKNANLLSRNYFSDLFLLAVVCCLLLLISPALLGQLSGTFKKDEVPRDYIVFKNFLHSQTDFSRTLWVPRQQRFSYFSKTHPPVEAMYLVHATNSAQAIDKMKKNGPSALAQLSIKYVIVPYDSTEDIFLKDRKYDEKEYQKTIKMLEEIPWLQKIDGFGEIAVFGTPEHYDHFWLTGDGAVTYTMVDTSRYKITVDIKSPQKLIFAENYNSYWQAKIGSSVIDSMKTKNGLNSFYLSNAGKYTGEVTFLSTKYYQYGRIISFITFLGILSVVVKYRKQ